MRHRESYDTSVKHLYRKGLEEVIPIGLRKRIPRSTIHRWRNEEKNKYKGCELNELASSELDLLKEFIRSKNAKRIFMTYVRIGRFIESIATDKYIRSKFKEHKEELIDIVDRARQNLPLEQILKCFKLSKTTYNLWVLGLYGNCSKSKLDWCLSKQSSQLTPEEIDMMESLLSDKEFAHWPISSIAHYASRNGLIHISLSTWYKYSKILKVNRERAPKKRHRKRIGIKASRPNEIWHADVSYFKIGLKNYYIYFLVDNYSRKILSHTASGTLSAEKRLETIKTAYDSHIGTNPEELLLMVDGGSENNNHLVDNYVSGIPHLQKLRALHDIRFGNTQVEAHFRTLKYNWLYRKQINDLEHLQHELDIYVQDFNERRPAHALKGMTPEEMYNEEEHYLTPKKRRQQKQARKDRRTSNKCNACDMCQFKGEIKFEEY